MVIAVACSAAFPRMATTKMPTKALLSPSCRVLGSMAATRILLLQAIRTEAAPCIGPPLESTPVSRE
jgi:hypothetical protein